MFMIAIALVLQQQPVTLRAAATVFLLQRRQ
jgi:hypothetical protein